MEAVVPRDQRRSGGKKLVRATLECHKGKIDCGTVRLTQSTPAPVGLICQCGWRFGSYATVNTESDEGPSIASLIVLVEKEVIQSQHGA